MYFAIILWNIDDIEKDLNFMCTPSEDSTMDRIIHLIVSAGTKRYVSALWYRKTSEKEILLLLQLILF